MDDNKNKEPKKKDIDEEIEKAQKDMEDLMKSIQQEMGNQNVKVVKLELPKPTLKNFFIGLILSLLINTLLIVGTSGFVDVFVWENILDLVYFSIYFTLVERTINFIFIKLFMPLIIRTMGIAAVLPYLLSITLVLVLPLFVIIENILTSLLMIVFVCVCKSRIHSFLQQKMFKRKLRRKKK